VAHRATQVLEPNGTNGLQGGFIDQEMSWLNRVAIFACLLSVAGCAAGELPYPPTLKIPLPDNEWGKFTLLVYDETGLVTGGQSGRAAAANGAQPSAVTADPERNELVVEWTGGACSHLPYLRLRGNANNLDLVIAPAPIEISLSPAIQCPAVGILETVTLTLTQPVEQAAVEITEIR
jgi:hypothetical protein